MENKKMLSLPTRLLITRAKSWYLVMVLGILGSFGLGAIGGLEYAGYNASPKEKITAEYQISEGTYGYINADDALATFAFNGGDSDENDDGEPENYDYRYVVMQIGEKLVAVKFTPYREKLLKSANNEIFGTFLPVDPEIKEMLSDWAKTTIWPDKDESEIEELTSDLVFATDYVGYQKAWLGMLLFYAFSALAVIAAVVVFRIFTLNFKIYDYADYVDGRDFGPHLHIAKGNVWIFIPFREYEVKRVLLTGVVPRSKRLEGGKLKWRLNFITNSKIYSVPMPSKEIAQSAVDYYNETARSEKPVKRSNITKKKK